MGIEVVKEAHIDLKIVGFDKVKAQFAEIRKIADGLGKTIAIGTGAGSWRGTGSGGGGGGGGDSRTNSKDFFADIDAEIERKARELPEAVEKAVEVTTESINDAMKKVAAEVGNWKDFKTPQTVSRDGDLLDSFMETEDAKDREMVPRGEHSLLSQRPDPNAAPGAKDAVSIVSKLKEKMEELPDTIHHLNRLMAENIGKNDALATRISEVIKAKEEEYDKIMRVGNAAEVAADAMEHLSDGGKDAVAMVASMISGEKDLEDSIRVLTGMHRDMVGVDDLLAERIKKVIEAKEDEMDAIKGFIKVQETLTSSTKRKISETAGKISEKVGEARARAGEAASAFSKGEFATAAGAGIESLMAASSAAAAALAPVAIAAAAVAAAMIGLPAAFVGVARMISGYTDAIDPGLTAMLNLAMRDMTAIIGSALVPVLTSMVGVINNFSGAMIPLAESVGGTFKRLREFMEPMMNAFVSLWSTVANALLPVFNVLASVAGIGASLLGAAFNVLNAVMMPVTAAFQAVGVVLEFLLSPLEYLGAVFYEISNVIQIAVTAFMALIKALFASTGAGTALTFMTDIIRYAIKGVRDFADMVIIAGAKVMKFFGAGFAVQAVADAMKPGEDPQGFSAAKNAKFESVENMGREMATRAIMAAGPGNEQSEDEKRNQRLVDELNKIALNGTDVTKLLAELPQKIADAITNKGKEVKESVKNSMENMSNWNPLSWGVQPMRMLNEWDRGRKLDAQRAKFITG